MGKHDISPNGIEILFHHISSYLPKYFSMHDLEAALLSMSIEDNISDVRVYENGTLTIQVNIDMPIFYNTIFQPFINDLYKNLPVLTSKLEDTWDGKYNYRNSSMHSYIYEDRKKALANFEESCKQQLAHINILTLETSAIENLVESLSNYKLEFMIYNLHHVSLTDFVYDVQKNNYTRDDG
jgi:hypothetical protein